MENAIASPRIRRVRWGRVELDDHGTSYKDAKLFPGGSREWDWAETGTRHVPGIQSADIAELLQHGAAELVLSTGFYERLQVAPETREVLQQKGIPFHILQTEEAAAFYNERCQSVPLGALIHSTC